MVNIFVYGTLRKGQMRHNVMEQIGAVFKGNAVLKGYIKREFKQGGYPFIYEGKGQVEGEVYAINEKDLNILDDVEGVYIKLFERRKDKVLTENGEEVEVYFYEAGEMLKRAVGLVSDSVNNKVFSKSKRRI